MTVSYPSDYYDRSDASKKYERHLFLPGRVPQSAEFNEIQTTALERAKNIGDQIFKDGDVVRNASLIINNTTAIGEAGQVYIRGAIRDVATRTFYIPTNGTVFVGVWLLETIVDANVDSDLLDPAASQPNYDEPGASRLKVDTRWGKSTDNLANGTFYQIYTVVNGQLPADIPPPQSDFINKAIAQYDVDSSGSNYIVSGMKVTALPDSGGSQVYEVAAGSARVNGTALKLQNAYKASFPVSPDRKYIDSEAHVSTTDGTQRVDVNNAPAAGSYHVLITKRTTRSMTRGSFAGTSDVIPGVTVLAIESVTQGMTTYVVDDDYILSAGSISWSPGGAEPTPGSTYSMTYLSIEVVVPSSYDDTGFTITGAVSGQLILVSYDAALPRIDRLCLMQDGSLAWVMGVSSENNLIPPQVPANAMALAQIVQKWGAYNKRTILNDGTRMIPMTEIEEMRTRMNLIIDLISQQSLIANIVSRQSAPAIGLYVDGFIDDNIRDQGIEQTAAIIDGALTLPIFGPTSSDSLRPTDDITDVISCPYTEVVLLSQELVTGEMKLNPYDSFNIIPSSVVLVPSVDNWTVVAEQWLSPITSVFYRNSRSSSWLGAGIANAGVLGGVIGGLLGSSSSSSSTPGVQNALLKSWVAPISFLRESEIEFTISGFGAGETLTSVIFDGINVTSSVTA